MYLEKCYVSSFGKFKDYSIDFNNGLNTIKEDNGWGKTTLATFIKVMFYGIDNGRKSISESDRKKYRPWNSTEKFGGYLEFNWKGKSYRLERYFGLKEVEDTVRLTDLSTGKVHEKDLEDLGNRIFDVDEDGFNSTTYFSQKDFEIKSNTSITEQFNAMYDGEKNNMFETAVRGLEAKSKELKLNRGNGGLIYLTKVDIFDLKEEIEKLKNSSDTLAKLNEQVKSLEKDISVLTEEIKIISEKSKLASEINAILFKKKLYKECNEKIIDIKEKIEKINSVLSNKDISLSEINGYAEVIKDFENNVQIVRSLEKTVKELKNTPNIIDKKPNNLIFVWALPILAVILSIVSVFTFVKAFTLIPIICILLAISLFVAFFVLIKKGKNTKSTNPSYDVIIQSKVKEIEEYISINQGYQTKLDQFFSLIKVEGESYVDKLNELKFILKERDRLYNDLLDQENSLKKFSLDKDVFAEVSSLDLDADKLKEEFDIKNRELNRLNLQLAEKKSSIVIIENQINNLSDLENKLSELEENLSKYERDYEIINKTLTCLKTAEENLKIKYKQPLENAFRKYLSLISGDDASKANINVDMEVTMTESGGAKETAYYSKGYRDLFNICKRFALIDLLFIQEKPFIILDDPFYNLDDDKIKKSLNLIKALSKKYQILYFVCHESRRP